MGAGTLKASAVTAKASASVAPLLTNSQISVTVNGTRVFLNGSSEVKATDVLARNGVIHVIDQVLLPPQDSATLQNIVSIVQTNSNFSTLLKLVSDAGLAETLQNGNWTVFAPTDTAFAKLLSTLTPAQTNNLLAKETLTKVLLYHVVPGTLLDRAVLALADDGIFTAETSTVKPSLAGANAFINSSKITSANLRASNGVIHVIDTVLVPAGLAL